MRWEEVDTRIINSIRSLLNVFGDGFGSFGDGMSGEFSGEDKLDSRLDFSGWESSSLVESDELGSFSGNSVESIMNERVHDVHGFLWDTDFGVHLLEDFVDVDREGLDSSSSGFLVSLACSFCWCFVFSCHFIKYWLLPLTADFKLKLILSDHINP